MAPNGFNGFTDNGAGVGLRVSNYSHILSEHPIVDWFEIISEDYMVDGLQGKRSTGAPRAVERPSNLLVFGSRFQRQFQVNREPGRENGQCFAHVSELGRFC